MRARASAWYAPDTLDKLIAAFRGESPDASPARLYFDIAPPTLVRRDRDLFHGATHGRVEQAVLNLLQA